MKTNISKTCWRGKTLLREWGKWVGYGGIL